MSLYHISQDFVARRVDKYIAWIDEQAEILPTLHFRCFLNPDGTLKAKRKRQPKPCPRCGYVKVARMRQRR